MKRETMTKLTTKRLLREKTKLHLHTGMMRTCSKT